MVLTLERTHEQRRRWGRLVARAWEDEPFRRRLLAEPEAVLRQEGIDVPEGVEVRVLEEEAPRDTGEAAYLRLPGRPAAADLIEDDLTLPHGSTSARRTHHSCYCVCGAPCLRLPPRPTPEDLTEEDLGTAQLVGPGATKTHTCFSHCRFSFGTTASREK
jgi:hypothetical protein